MMLTVRPVDVLVSKYYRSSMEIVSGDIRPLPIDPQALAVYDEAKMLQDEAQALGYDLDLETARQMEADSDANSTQ